MNRERPPSRLESWLFRVGVLGVVSLVPILIVTTAVARSTSDSREKPANEVRVAATPVPLPRIRIMTVDPDRELVYIINNEAKEQDLSGWRLVSRGGRPSAFLFPMGYHLAPGAIVRIHTYGGVDSAGDLYWNLSPGDKVWGERGDTGSLQDANGHLVSTFSYARW